MGDHSDVDRPHVDPPEATVSWRMLRAEAERRLAQTSGPDPGQAALDARRLVERSSGLGGAELVLGLDRPATRREVAFFDQMLERRLTGEPLQYVLGVWDFRTIELLVDRRALIPRPETEVVVGHALAEIDRCRAAAPAGRLVRAVDLGTGSGAIGLSLAAERPGLEVWLTEASPDALALARANLAGLGGPATRVNVVEGDWFAALPPELLSGIDVVVSNPPYIATDDDIDAVVLDWEPASALFAGPDGLDDLRTLVAQAPRWLAPGGALVLELGSSQAERVLALARESGFANCRIEPDLAGRPRCLVARV